jgi:hypothetical protein
MPVPAAQSMLLTTVPVSVAPAPVLDPTTTGKGSQSLCSPRARRRTSRLISIRSLSRTGVIERARLTEPIRIRGFLYPQFPAIVTRVRTQTISPDMGRIILIGNIHDSGTTIPVRLGIHKWILASDREVSNTSHVKIKYT